MQNEPSTKAVANDDLVSQNLPGVGDISLNIFGVASNESVTPLQATLGEAAAFGQYYKERHGLPPEADHNNYDCILEAWKAWQSRSELVATQIPSPHPDDVAVDSFSAAMKVKLALAREKGRSGWETCPPEELSRMLREHVEKGDPRDVANFCMFLWSLGHSITAQQPLTDEQINAGRQELMREAVRLNAQAVPDGMVTEALKHLRAVVREYQQAHIWRMRQECDDPEPGAELKEKTHQIGLVIAMDEAEQLLSKLSAEPTAPQPAQHPDDEAVDRFAEAMKQKLAQAREKGRGGWETCPPEELSRMLREHVDKGDPRDVANFCAFLWAQGHGISAAHASQSTTRAAIDVLAERQRQSSVEGWTPEHDEMHSHGEIARAAACYALYNTLPTPTIWPWESDRWKPTEDHRRNLVRAGALILAEIERIDRVNVIKDLA